MKRQFAIQVIGFLVAILVLAFSPGYITTAFSDPAAGQMSQEEQRAFELLNADRRANGVPALAWDPVLAALARDYAQDMVSRNFFSHESPEGQSPFDRMKGRGIKFLSAGENLAGNSSVEAAEQALMNSPGHRRNILDREFNQVGIGVWHENDGSVVVVQEFIGN